jgi:signal transduction histidine kinase
MSIAVNVSPVRNFRAGLRTGLRPDWVARLAVATGGLAAIVIGLELVKPIHVTSPSGRAALETLLVLSAIFTARLLVANFQDSGRLPDLMLLGALSAVSLTDFAYCAVPALTAGVRPEAGGGARLSCSLIVSAAFAAAALAPNKQIRYPGPRAIGGAILAGASVVTLSQFIEQATGAHWNATLQDVGIQGAIGHPVALTVQLVAAALLVVAGLAFLRRARRGESRYGLLAGAAFLLAAARLQYLALPAVGTDWITPREGLRIAAYALLLASAYWEYVLRRRARALAAITLERERIARDLHDGLAQDLACIAQQGQRLGTELEPEHPLMIAARNALATSRGVIADLSASTAPTTDAALRIIASELRHRYGLQIDLRIETPGGSDLDPVEREHVVRIAREGIVNAATHGAARHVDVVVVKTGRALLMTVRDDGCGIADSHRPGMGLRTMRARAAALGGWLTACPRVDGGTELQLVAPARFGQPALVSLPAGRR